jgi:hypothetical protein
MKKVEYKNFGSDRKGRGQSRTEPHSDTVYLISITSETFNIMKLSNSFVKTNMLKKDKRVPTVPSS